MMSTNTAPQSRNETETDTKDVLTRADISRLGNVGETTVTTWIESGSLPAYDVSADGSKYRNWRITMEDWESFKLSRGNKGFANRQTPPKTTSIPEPKHKHF